MTTRMRVPRGCKGLDFQFGGSLNANRRGIVEVPDELVKDVRKGTDGVAALPLVGFGGSKEVAEKICDHCAFTNWAWRDTCARCDSPLPKPEAETINEKETQE